VTPGPGLLRALRDLLPATHESPRGPTRVHAQVPPSEGEECQSPAQTCVKVVKGLSLELVHSDEADRCSELY
jgi:hypothetical protein